MGFTRFSWRAIIDTKNVAITMPWVFCQLLRIAGTHIKNKPCAIMVFNWIPYHSNVYLQKPVAEHMLISFELHKDICWYHLTMRACCKAAFGHRPPCKQMQQPTHFFQLQWWFKRLKLFGSLNRFRSKADILCFDIVSSHTVLHVWHFVKDFDDRSKDS